MKYKKIFINMTILIATFLLLCSCSSDKKTSEVKIPVTTPYTTVIDGKTMTAQRVGTDDSDYQIGCYDENGVGKRLEYYKNGKLIYYYITTDYDKKGNETIQKYYDSSDKLFATVKNGDFYDARGKKITEEKMNEIISGLE